MDTVLASNVAMAAFGLRVLCGLFYLPHILFKVTSSNIAVGLFEKAGFKPAKMFVALAATMESICAVCLIFGLYTQWAALLAFALMMAAAWAIFKLNGPKWKWLGGGVEYPLFWGLVSLFVAVLHWQQ